MSMAVFHPVFLVTTLVAGLIYNAYLKGPQATLKSLAWQVPLFLIIALLNPVFSASGSTELFRIGTQAIYFESLAYGACMGCMLLSMFVWFSNASQVLSSDKIMELTGKHFPVIALMITMILRLVPQFVRRGQAIADTNSACTAAYGGTVPSGVSTRLRQITVLMGWSMEDSLETADAMRARGWDSAEKRTQYKQAKLQGMDVFVLVAFVALVVLDVAGAIMACSNLAFYPAIVGVFPCWPVISHLIVLALPLYLELYVRIRS